MPYSTPTKTSRKVFSYDGAPGAPKKRKSARLANKLQNLGLAETTLASCTPVSSFPSITKDQVLHPNYAVNLAALEGTGQSGYNHNPTAWLKHTDGKYGLLSYRANLGPERLLEADGATIVERGLNVLNLHKSKVKGDATYVKNIHLKTRVKYLTPEPGSGENLPEPQSISAIRHPPEVHCRMLVVRVKRDKLGLPMYSLDNSRSHHDNPVGSELFLDPIGRPFGINQDNYSTGTILSEAIKPQTPFMHFKCPVQKKFFDVLATKDFILGPQYSQAKGVGYAAVQPPLMHTGLPRPNYQDINLTIPINELVEYVPAKLELQNSDANHNYGEIGNENYMVTPKDLNIFDTKIIIYAHSPSDTLEDWGNRLAAFDAGSGATGVWNQTFSSVPHIVFDYYGVVETIDNQ